MRGNRKDSREVWGPCGCLFVERYGVGGGSLSAPKSLPLREGGIIQAAPIGGSAERSEAIGVARRYVAFGNTLMVRLLGPFVSGPFMR